MPVGGRRGVEKPPLLGVRYAPATTPGLCGLRRPLRIAGDLLEPLVLLRQGAGQLAHKEGGDPGRALSVSAGPKSVAAPEHPRAQLSQRVDLGDEIILQTAQGRDPGSKALYQLHSGYM